MLGTYVALGLFVLMTVALAVYRRPSSDSDYLIRDRQVGTFETAAATFTLLGGGEFVTLTALTYLGLLHFVWVLWNWNQVRGRGGRVQVRILRWR